MTCQPLPNTPIATYGAFGFTAKSIPHVCGGAVNDWNGPYLGYCFALRNKPVYLWTFGPEMNYPRSFAAATPFIQSANLGRSVYVAGGGTTDTQVSISPTNFRKMLKGGQNLL